MDKFQKICIGLSSLSLIIASMAVVITWSSKSKKLAYVNTLKLMDQVELMGQVKETIKEQEQEAQKRLDTLDTEYRASLFAFEKDQKKLNKGQKQKEVQKLEYMKNQLIHYHAGVKETISKNRKDLLSANLVKINEVIKAWGREKGYDIILATSSGNIAYANDALDITDAIADKINHP